MNKEVKSTVDKLLNGHKVFRSAINKIGTSKEYSLYELVKLNMEVGVWHFMDTRTKGKDIRKVLFQAIDHVHESFPNLETPVKGSQDVKAALESSVLFINECLIFVRENNELSDYYKLKIKETINS